MLVREVYDDNLDLGDADIFLGSARITISGLVLWNGIGAS